MTSAPIVIDDSDDEASGVRMTQAKKRKRGADEMERETIDLVGQEASERRRKRVTTGRTPRGFIPGEVIVIDD